MRETLIVRYLGLMEYQVVWSAMRQFTDQRLPETFDEIWFVEHPPVFTQGQAGKAEHLLAPAEIPVVQTDRGGQVTYHGPGQLVCYFLINLKRRQLNIRALVCAVEQIMIDTLLAYGVNASRKENAPGVYVNRAKVGSLGLRVRRGCSYHGLSLNVEMDLSPFLRINPCGFSGLEITQLCMLYNKPLTIHSVAECMAKEISKLLDYSLPPTWLEMLPECLQTNHCS